MNNVLVYWIAAYCFSSRPVGRNSEECIQKKWLRSYGRPRILVVDRHRRLRSGIFAEEVQRDCTRLKKTPHGRPSRNGKTERTAKDWKDNYYKTTQDGPEARTWTDFEEDCDAVNQARSSKNQRQATVHISSFSAEFTHRWKVSRQQERELAQKTVDD